MKEKQRRREITIRDDHRGRRKSQSIGVSKQTQPCPENSREERNTDKGGEAGDTGKNHASPERRLLAGLN